MFPYQVSIAEAEGRMVLTQLDESFVVVENLRVSTFPLPVEEVDAVGRVVAVVYPLLVAQQFFATEHEGHTLTCHHCRLCQQVQADEFLF